jgi:glucose-6-phosphate 1-dehydrogenase
VGGEEAEEAWRIVEPVSRAWSEDRVPMEEYEAGSEGPSPLAA